MGDAKIYVIVPAYNEQAMLRSTISSLLTTGYTIRQISSGWPVQLVESCFRDATQTVSRMCNVAKRVIAKPLNDDRADGRAWGIFVGQDSESGFF